MLKHEGYYVFKGLKTFSNQNLMSQFAPYLGIKVTIFCVLYRLSDFPFQNLFRTDIRLVLTILLVPILPLDKRTN